MSRLPNFMIPGVARCGTTSLFNYLAAHPKLIGPKSKELHFFNRQYSEEHISMLYIERWDVCDDEEALFYEATPDYLFEPMCAPRIKYWIPDCKFLILLRNPVDRAWSYWYWYFMRLFGTTLQELRELPDQVTYKMRFEAMKSGVNARSKRRILQEGMYARILKHWFQYFPRENNKIIRSEDFFFNPEPVLNECLDFLSVDSTIRFIKLETFPKLDPLKPDVRIETPRIPDDIRESLTKFFKPLNDELYNYLGRDFGW